MKRTTTPQQGGEVANKQQHYNTQADQLQNAIAQIQADQLGNPEIITDGKRRRYTVVGDKPKSNNGWVQAFIDINGVLVVHYGSWRTGQSCTFIGNRNSTKPLTTAERRASVRQIQEQKRERKKVERQGHLATKKEAQEIWGQAKHAEFEFSYLVAKQVGAYGVAKFKQQLLIPLRDAKGVIWNLQRIYPNGKKFYLKNGRILGLFHTIGQPENSEHYTIYIGEGYATMASIHEKTGKPSIVAFSTANLTPVAIAVRRSYPQARIIIACDNDRFTKGNPGITYGKKAATAIRAEYIYPEFPAECTTGTDFNDLINFEKEAANVKS